MGLEPTNTEVAAPPLDIRAPRHIGPGVPIWDLVTISYN